MAECPDISIFDVFIPKTGYKLQHLLCCTYGVDPNVILTLILFCLGEADSEFLSGTSSSSQKEKLRLAFSEGFHKTTILTAKEAQKMCEPHGPAQILLTQNIFSLSAATELYGSFHPKLILALYENDNGFVYGKFHIGSKNLTRSNLIEFGISLEIKKFADKKLINLIKNLGSEPGLKKRGRDSLKKIEQYLVDKNLGLPPGFDLSFQARGENSPLLQEFVGNYLDGAKSVFIHSPWIKKGALDAIISRLGNRAKVGVRCLPLKANVDVLNEYPNIAKGFDNEVLSTGQLTGGNSHHKIIFFKDKNNKKQLIFGSANCTNRGHGIGKKNTEILIKYSPDSNAYDYLEKIDDIGDLDGGGQHPIIGEKERDALHELHKLDIEIVNYDRKEKSLIYIINKTPNLNFEITHYLIEEVNGKSTLDPFMLGPNHIETFEIPYLGAISNISNYIIISLVDNSEINFDLTIELDKEFYDSRKDITEISYFKLSHQEWLEAIYDILGIPVDGPRPALSPGDGQWGDPELLVMNNLLENYPLDRLAVKLSKMKGYDKALYDIKRKRLEDLRLDIKKTIKESSDKKIIKLINSFDSDLGVILDACE